MNPKKRVSALTETTKQIFDEHNQRIKAAEEVKRRECQRKLHHVRAGHFQTVEKPSIEIYGQGIKTHRPVKGVKPPNSGGLRDVITGWSMKSRRRMREYLLSHSAPDGWLTIGPSFTIPGPPISHEAASNLWADFCLRVYKSGWGMVWRVEIQKRGALHWHSLLIGNEHNHPHDVAMLWRETLRTLGPCVHEVNGKTYEVQTRAALPGADSRACMIPDCDGKRGAWLRYLQDHSTKAKQEQIPESIGRHWGVVGRKRFIETKPIIKVEMTDKQFAKALRCLQRLWTPSRPNPKAPFGRSLSYTPTRGRRGHCVAFTRPETSARIVEWALHA